MAGISTLLKIAAVPTLLAGYILVAGRTGFCPACTAILNVVTGETAGAPVQQDRPIRGDEISIRGLTARTMDGRSVDLGQYLDGKTPVILDFWATWCPPCRDQRRTFAEMADELNGRAVILSLSVDQTDDTVREFIAKEQRGAATNTPGHAIDLMATIDTANTFNIRAIPTLIYTDGRGVIRFIRTGAQSAASVRRDLHMVAAGP